MLRQCSGYGCRPYGRCQSPTQLGERCGQRWYVCACVSESVSESMCVCDSVCVGGLSAAAVQWLRVSPVWEVPKSYTARRGAWADSVSERVCVCQRACQRVCVCVCVCVSESAFQRERVCLCLSESPYAAAVQWLRVLPVWEVPKPCSARRGVWAEIVCVGVREGVRERLCVSARVCARDIQSLCVCQRECVSAQGEGVCVSESVSERECQRVCVCMSEVSMLQQCSGYGCRPYGRCQSPAQLSKGCVCVRVCACVREGVREIRVCVHVKVCVSARECHSVCKNVCQRESACVCVCVSVGRFSAAAVQWLRVSPVWEVPKPCSANSSGEGVVCVSQSDRDTRVRVREGQCVSESVSTKCVPVSVCVCVCVCISESVCQRVCVCQSARQRPLCCSSVVATGVAPYGRCQSPAQLSEMRGQREYVCQSESVCVREGVRVCVREYVCVCVSSPASTQYAAHG